MRICARVQYMSQPVQVATGFRQASTRGLSFPRRSTALTTMASAAPSLASSGTAQSTRDAGATAKRHWSPKRDQIAYIALALPATSFSDTDGPLRTAATDGAPG